MNMQVCGVNKMHAFSLCDRAYYDEQLAQMTDCVLP